MILTRSGDMNLNRFPQAQVESAMEGLKQAMLEHELIFRNQVRELHRLYWTQKNLMNEIRKGFGETAEGKQSADEKNAGLSQFYGAREVGASQDRNVCVSLENHQRNFNLHLPANDFIGGPANLPANNHSQIGGDGTLETLRLGSAIGDGILKKNMRSPSFLCKERIDLEESMDFECNEEENEAFSPEFKSPTQTTSGLFGSKATILCDKASSSIVGCKQNLLPSTIHVGEEDARRLKEREPPVSSGVPGESSPTAVTYPSSSNHEFLPLLLDLNAPHDDECYHDPNEPAVNIASPFKDSSLCEHGVDAIEPIKSCPDGTSLVSELGSGKPIEASSYEKRADNRVDVILTGLTRGSTNKQSNREGSEEDTLSSQQDTHVRKYSAGYSTDDSVTTQLNSPKNEISSTVNRKIEEEQEASVAIAAAEALVSISLGSIELVGCDDRSSHSEFFF